MLTQYESELLKGVASNPAEVSRYLVSPDINMGVHWFTSPLALRVFPVIARDALMDKPASFISIAASITLSPQELVYLKEAWMEGKATHVDIPRVVNILRNDSLSREVNKAISQYGTLVKDSPNDIRDHVDTLGSTLAILAHDGVGYNPIPSSHRNDVDVRIGTSWGSTTIDKMFDGGVPNQGYALVVAPTGSGKSSYLRTLATYAIAKSTVRELTDVCICTNEMRSGETSRTIHAALKNVWAGERSDDEIWGDMDHYMRIYERVNDWEKLDRILYWERPKVAIIDSLDNLGYPNGTEKFQIDEKHKARANGIADMSVRYGCFIGVVGNASEGAQRELRNGVGDVKSVMAFGSAWYQNISTWSFALARSKDYHNRTEIKRVKNRPKGLVGEIWQMGYSPEGKYYHDIDLKTVNL